jgi:hypothetical protein
MKNESDQLVITLDELQKILDYAKNRAQYDSMKSTLEIGCKKGKITITQYCHYAECNPIFHVR